MRTPLTVHAFESRNRRAWQAFIATASNATLFLDLDFLDYHPPGRFQFHHLLVSYHGETIAVVPGGIVEEPDGIAWKSPVGASVGGPVLAPYLRMLDVVAVIEALQAYARAQQWRRIDITLPPSVYHPTLGDELAFALSRCGFRELHRWLCSLIEVSPLRAETTSADAGFESRQRRTLNAAVRQGATAADGGLDRFDEFIPLFEDTYARLGARPTHTLDEIATLLRRFPDRIWLTLARDGREVTAGFLTMRLTDQVANAFYLCRRNGRLRSAGTLVALATLVDGCATRGIRWLDCGPSISDGHLNAGALLFKEGLGCVGYSRTQWSWNATP
jgi:hypothetical protein